MNKEFIENPVEAYEKLKKENERLKALCDTYRTCYQAKHGDIKCLFIKYKQTLQKIKTIAKENLIGCFADKCDLAGEILDLIIKEVENE